MGARRADLTFRGSAEKTASVHGSGLLGLVSVPWDVWGLTWETHRLGDQNQPEVSTGARGFTPRATSRGLCTEPLRVAAGASLQRVGQPLPDQETCKAQEEAAKPLTP